MSRFKVAILLLLAVTLIYPVTLHLDIQRYEAWKQAELEKNPQWAGIMDFAPYTSTNTGALMVITGVLTVGFWLMVIVHRKKLKSAMLMALMFTVVLAFTPRAYAGYYETTVDVLAAEDEEFRWCYPAGWQRDLGWGLFIKDAFGKFEKEFGIIFKLRGWIDWDSRDYTGSLVDLLDEAIEETNFESQVTTYNDYVIDILMVFTGEPQEERPGFSPPDLKALIIDGLTMAPRDRVVQHELSHQFFVDHCGNDCVMNLAKWQPLVWIPNYWCGQCEATINDNKDRFWRYVNLPPKTPSKPSGPTSGYVGLSYTYSSVTTDPDGHNIRYQFVWGDGSTTTTGWNTSGHTVWASHRWNAPRNPYFVKVRAQDVYEEWSNWSPFRTVVITSGGGGGPICPTLFVWDGSDYIDLGVIDIHADEDVVREVPVPSESVGVNAHKAQFRLREGWEGLTYSHSEIDQVKLHAVDSDGNQRLCPLVNATHSELGNVLPRLLLSDDRRIDLYLLETTDLEFAVPQTNEIQEFVFVIEGCNMVKR